MPRVSQVLLPERQLRPDERHRGRGGGGGLSGGHFRRRDAPDGGVFGRSRQCRPREAAMNPPTLPISFLLRGKKI